MSESSVEQEVSYTRGELPEETPTGQSFTPEQLGSTGTPWGVKDDAGDRLTNKIREKVAKTMNSEILLCPITNFLTDYGPIDVTEEEVARCKSFLLKTKHLTASGGNLRWKEYAENPSRYSDNEPRVFDDLKTIVDAIFKYAETTERLRGNDYNFEMVPNTHLDSDISGANHKMDASIVESGYRGGKLAVRYSVVPQEYKKERDWEHQIEVRQQVAGDCQHIMSEDPRRMFIFAITIEDTRMSVWYFSRSHSMKALSFDWVEKDIDQFIQVFMAFAYATPAELGLDPHIHKAPVNSNAKPGTNDAAQHYIYQCPVVADNSEDSESAPADNNAGTPIETVTPLAGPRRSERLVNTKPTMAQVPAIVATSGTTFKYFKTVKAVNLMRPYCMSGRTTRIWQVIEVDSPITGVPIPGAEVAILKDVWLDEKRATEAENMDSVFEAIESLVADAKKAWGTDWKNGLMKADKRFAGLDQDTQDRLAHLLSDGRYKSLFLTKLHAWKGEISKKLSGAALQSAEGFEVFVEDYTRLKPGLPSRTRVASDESTSDGDETDSEEESDAKPAQGRTGRRYVRKQQSRFIYKEVCQDLNAVGTLGNLMVLIDQALDALRILFAAGWVHRDISHNNLLAFEDNGAWKLKLSDLEFSETLAHKKHRFDPRTGTPYFMPYEILMRRYLIDSIRYEREPQFGLVAQLGLASSPESPHYGRYKDFKRFGRRITSVPANATDKIPAEDDIVRYTFQHDLESIWWIVFYFITACVRHTPSQAASKKIFTHSLKMPGERILSFRDSFQVMAGVHLHPKLKAEFTEFMEDLRDHLVEQYLAREVFGQIDIHESYTGIHKTFAASLKSLLDNNEGNWKEIPILPSSAVTIDNTLIGIKRGKHGKKGPSKKPKVG